MTDALSIQGAEPQKRTNPYLAGGLGAAAGAGVGWGATALYNSRNTGETKSFDDLVKDANEKDKVELQSKKEALDKAQQTLDDASKPVVDKNTPEQVMYDDAVKAKQDAYDKLFNEKKAMLEQTGDGVIDSKKIRPFDKIVVEEYPNINAETGKPFKKPADIENVYNRLTNDLKNAESKLESKISSGVGGEKATKETRIQGYLNGEYSTYGTQSIEDIEKAFSERTELKGLYGFRSEKPTAQYQRAINQALVEFPEFKEANLKPEHFLEFGKEVSATDPIEKGYTRKSVNLIDPKTGRPSPKPTYIEYKPADLQAFVEQQENAINTKRIAYADELFTNARESVLLQKQKATYLNDFGATVEKGLAKQSGYYNDATNFLNMSDIANEANRTRNTITRKSGRTITGYAADIEKLNEAIRNAKKAGTAPSMPTLLNGDYAGVTDVNEALKQAGARNRIAKDYNSGLKDLETRIANCVSENSIIRDLEQKIETIKANDKGVSKARAKLAEQFPALFGESSTLGAEEIEKQAKEYAEKNLKPTYQETIDKLKGDLDKAIEKSGKVDEGAKKTAQEALEKAKGEYDKLIADLSGKVKGIHGGAKAAIIGGAAAIAGLIGLGIANSNNKDA